MANFAYIAASLDGFIATADDGLEWLDRIPNPEGGDFGFSRFLAGVDGILMGRRTFGKVCSFQPWPYDKMVFVLSGTLDRLPGGLEGKAQLVSGPPADVVARLGDGGFRNLYIDGGQVIQSFLREDLLDELIITRVPTLLGHGIPLFGGLDRILEFSHVETEVLGNCLVKSRYRRERNEDGAR